MQPRPFIYNPPKTELNIIYKDGDILVLDKPSGLLSVAGNQPHLADCLESRAKAKFPNALIVHRLDKDTSGIIILALNKKSHANIGLQFEKRKIEKQYIANVWGEMKHDSGQIDAPLITDWINRPKQKIDFEKGKSAVTNWQVIKRNNNFTTTQLSPITGRSHQLRVHMLSLGHPILGDNLYAHDEALKAAKRLELHATFIKFTHPTNGKHISFTSKPSF